MLGNFAKTGFFSTIIILDINMKYLKTAKASPCKIKTPPSVKVNPRKNQSP